MNNAMLSLNQVTVAVCDIKVAIAFYEGLGLELIVEAAHYARFIVTGNEASFSIHLTDTVVNDEAMIYFETDDVDGKVSELKKKGFVFRQEPVMQSWLWYEAYLDDPFGNKICIYHAGKNRLNPPWRIKKSV